MKYELTQEDYNFVIETFYKEGFELFSEADRLMEAVKAFIANIPEPEIVGPLVATEEMVQTYYDLWCNSYGGLKGRIETGINAALAVAPWHDYVKSLAEKDAEIGKLQEQQDLRVPQQVWNYLTKVSGENVAKIVQLQDEKKELSRVNFDTHMHFDALMTDYKKLEEELRKKDIIISNLNSLISIEKDRRRFSVYNSVELKAEIQRLNDEIKLLNSQTKEYAQHNYVEALAKAELETSEYSKNLRVKLND